MSDPAGEAVDPRSVGEVSERASLDTLHERHRILGAHRCSCGWEGDSPTTHIIDTLGLEQVGWAHPRLGTLISVRSDNRPPAWSDPVYRLKGATDGR